MEAAGVSRPARERAPRQRHSYRATPNATTNRDWTRPFSDSQSPMNQGSVGGMLAWAPDQDPDHAGERDEVKRRCSTRDWRGDQSEREQRHAKPPASGTANRY